MRPLAVTTAGRFPQLPDVPTLAESGIPGFDVDIWHGFVALARTPPSIVKKLSEDLARVMADPQLQAKIRERGMEPAYLDGEKMRALMQQDVARWREIIHRWKLTLD